MTVSLAEATAAARRVAEMPPSDPEYVLRDFARDVETLKDFVLAGDTERLRTDFGLWLTWRCLNCGWETTMRAPGFAGDGHDHFPDGRTPCGPLRAQKAWPSEIAAEGSRAALAEGSP